jgi:amidase
MKHDLPKYLSENPNSKVHNVAEVIAFNKLDMALRAPYGQERLDGILTDTTSADELKAIVSEGQKAARSFFDEPIEEFDLDAITSINNYDASRAALAHYPALTLPMGYKETGEPVNLTLIAPGLSEEKLLQIAYAIEKQTRKRLPPDMMD